ncbi:gamma-interferon-inducible lysosomal thiol reductase-like [Chenopodium quinoa]|uniref:gamma-interferon-inducible lysosomal thiol reductase-like n=1 Tax=Chenopodium quinoa TaxID=63459 RepID=UPI000B78C343|nr:gamma-interferon-inducible lysosomal thiol reductase-like [Chenopodium quinoa]
MAFHVYHQTFLLFFLLHTFFFQYNSCSCYAQISELNDQKVDLTLYYETLCPYCSYFIAHDLVNLFSNGLISIVNLRLVPWGNAAVEPSGYFQCQHGSGECLLNAVEACTIDSYPDIYKHYFLIQCIESLAYQQREAEWQSCFDKVSLDSKPIFDCYNQGNGRMLEVQYAYETSQLNPPHEYVPWVLVNNQPLREDYQNFITYICKAYRGTSIPAACSSAEFMISSFGDKAMDISQQVCYVGGQLNLTSFVPTEILQQNREVFN